MPTPANSQHVDERLEELYRRHLLVGEDSVANYYESGRGHYKPELAAEERYPFSICIVRTDGKGSLSWASGAFSTHRIPTRLRPGGWRR